MSKYGFKKYSPPFQSGSDRFPANIRLAISHLLHRSTASVLMVILALFTVDHVAAQYRPGSGGVTADGYKSGIWQETVHHAERYQLPSAYRSFRLDLSAMRDQLMQAPHESKQRPVSQSPVRISVPMPGGGFSSFAVVETDVLHPELGTAYPEIRTYSGQGIEDPHAVVRFSITLKGFHAMVLSPEGNVFIDPWESGNTADYIVYDKRDLGPGRSFTCESDEALFRSIRRQVNEDGTSLLRTHGTQLRTYRLALAATGEYTAFHGGTKASALSAMVVSMNRVNGIYETEVAVRMVIIPNDTLIIYTNGSTDPYTNNNGSSMLGENINNINSVIGTANYDIGHVFSTGGGGVAYLGVPCTSNKAGGVTGSGSPVGDAFDVDYVAHEIGHQFGAQHTFNSVTSSCNGNRSSGSAYEPGSGITIMAYAGICGSDNLALNSIAYFHTHSFDQIVNFITTGSGSTCPVTTATGNSAPSATPQGLSFTIPFQTPFEISASGSDPNGDPITYSWEEYDLGPAGTWNNPTGNAPIFRPFSPVTTGTRSFPKLSDILNNTTTIGEILPSYARSLFFRVTARDNRAGGGGVFHIDDTVKVSVVNTTTPFAVTSPNTNVTWFSGNSATVTWNVSSTNVSPVNCANVTILLSLDGGNTFPFTLAATTPNDGSETVTVPASVSTQARVKVKGVGNIFFDISNVNFTIQAGSAVLSAITTDAIASTNICAGQSLNVSFSGNGVANSGNIYTAQLSGSTGSFASPVSIGSLSSSSSSGTIACTIPAGTAQGTGYRIRVVSSNPSVNGANNGADLSVFRPLGATGNISGPASVCQGQTGVVFSTTAVSNATTYAWTLPSGFSITSGSGSSAITVTVAANAGNGNVTVTPSNPCNTGSVSTAIFVNVNPLPAAAGTISGPSQPCQSSAGELYTVPAILNATSYSWTLPAGATIISGGTGNGILVSFGTTVSSGSVTVRGVNTCGSGTTSSLQITPQSAPAAPVISVSPSSSVCSGNTIQLSVTPSPGMQYQWRLNGVNINGATGSSYSANTSGSYDVVASIAPVGSRLLTTSTGVSIPDNSCTGATSTINVTGYNHPVRSSGIYVKINNITHTWVGDLDIYLETPAGQRLGLSDQTGNVNNSGDNFTNTVFADSGTSIIPTSGAPYTGLYKPWNQIFTVSSCTGNSTNLTSFASIGSGSLNPNGIWSLKAYDRYNADTGRVVSWSLFFPYQTYSCASVSGPVSLSFLPAPTVTTYSPSSGNQGTLVTVNGSGFSTATGVLLNGSPVPFSIVSTTQLTFTVPAGASTGNITVINSCGNAVSPTAFSVTSQVSLQITLLVEGLHAGVNAQMVPVLGPAVSDTFRIELRSAVQPYGVVQTLTGVADLNGTLNLYLPGTFVGQSYYFVVKNRNTVETWSKVPVLLGPQTVYSFKD